MGMVDELFKMVQLGTLSRYDFKERTGYRIVSSRKYKRRETPIKNPKIAAHVRMMHEKWHLQKFGTMPADR